MRSWLWRQEVYGGWKGRCNSKHNESIYWWKFCYSTFYRVVSRSFIDFRYVSMHQCDDFSHFMSVLVVCGCATRLWKMISPVLFKYCIVWWIATSNNGETSWRCELEYVALIQYFYCGFTLKYSLIPTSKSILANWNYACNRNLWCDCVNIYVAYNVFTQHSTAISIHYS